MSSLANGRSRCWVFTINGTHDFDTCNNVSNYTYMVVGKERAPKTGKRHLQGFVIYNTRTKFTTLKRQIPTAHIERMMGSSKEASDYCKKDGDYFEVGKFEDLAGYAGKNGSGGKQAKVNYTNIIKLAETHNFQEIKESDPGVYFRNYHTIKRIAMDNPLPVSNIDKLEHEWIWGATGLGKSSNARLENPGLYIKSHNKWWLGYKGEEVVLIDDLSKTEANWFGEHLKQWCDHYPFPAETKGDGMVIRPRKIIVTSNYSIEDCWGHDEHLCQSLLRRFKVRHIVDPFPQFKAKPIIIPDDDKEDSFLSYSEEEDDNYEVVQIESGDEGDYQEVYHEFDNDEF